MALVLKDRVKETAAAPGTGTITLGGAAAGFQSFSSVGNGNVTYFAIVDGVSGDWEVNYGTYTTSGSTLTRNSTPLSSSNSGALVNFTGTVDVFITYPSEQAVWQDTSGVVAQQSFGAITATSAALTTGTVSTSPASATDIANKQYVDGLVASGITYHSPVKYEVPNTTGNLNATYNQPGGPGVGVGATLTNAGTLAAFAPDGPTASVSDRILIYNQTNAFENGIYTVTTVGSGSVAWVLTRATDADTYALKSTSSLGNGDAFFITSGNTGAGETYVCNTVGTITFGTTAITFAQISDSTLYTAGTGLTLSGTEFSITPTGTAGTYGSASSVPVLTTNASGQVTSVTNTNIAINGSAVSGNISGSAGSVANALTLGTYLTGTSFNGSAAVTATVDATSANTASKVVARDSSGNFSAGTITATLSGSATSATTATNIAGGVANQIPYQTAAGTTSFITAASGTNYVLNYNGSTFNWVSGTISGVTLGSNLNSLTAGTYLTGTAYNGSAAQTWTVDATSANTASKVVARDASGNFSAGTITAALSGNATTATTATNLAGGSAGTIPYQSAAGTTVQLTAGTSGYILQSNGAAAPSWVVASTAAGVNNGTLTMAVSGTGLSGSATFTANQAGASTFTVTSNATSANTASAIVARDASGNFSAGTITATLSGNASTATSATTAGSITSQANSATITATSANTANQIVLRDASGNFSAGTITAALSGNATTSSSTTGNAATATALTSTQSSWTGSVAGNVVGLLGWKNYGNSHVIFDASASTSPSGGAVNNTNASVAWSATYPTLMGWNGTYTYGVRVDSARVADSATTATNQSGGTVSATTGSFSSTLSVGAKIQRTAAGAGYLDGNYSGVESTATSGAIYSIGGSYVPGTTNLGNMYGVGYTYSGYAAGNPGGVPSNVWGMYVASGGTARIWLDSDNGRGYFAGSINSQANIVAYYSSDIKFKENVQNIPNAAATAAAIGGKLFDWKDSYIADQGGEDGYYIQKSDFGVIAQDVLKHFPRAVRTRLDGSLAVDYEKLSALALAANAEHEARIAKLEALVAKLIEG